MAGAGVASQTLNAEFMLVPHPTSGQELQRSVLICPQPSLRQPPLAGSACAVTGTDFTCECASTSATVPRCDMLWLRLTDTAELEETLSGSITVTEDRTFIRGRALAAGSMSVLWGKRLGPV